MNCSRLISIVRPSALAAAALAATLLLLAGCGSSGSTGTITVGNENTSDNKLATEGTSTTAKGTESASVKTPTSGPLSKAPKVVPPPGPAPTKLQVKDIVKGTGKEISSESATVTVNYTGVLFHGGKEFDSSWKRGEPATFQLRGVIAGWTKGMLGMRVGGRRELVIPASLAYGAKGQGSIPANAPLVFVIDLLKA